MAHSRAGHGLLPISWSFRAAGIVAAKSSAYFRCSSIESSSGNGEPKIQRWSQRAKRGYRSVESLLKVQPSHDPEAVRVAQVRQLFSAGSYPHSGTGALIFFAWLENNRPELLPKDKLGDAFEHLKVDLAGLFKD